jgi:two-component system cell cycle response regulator
VKILIAEDSIVSTHLLFATLRRWGYDVVVANDGSQAWKELQKEDPPKLAILDWEMPGMTGPQVCRRVREIREKQYTYLLLLTSRNLKEDMVEGMESGADDYITKPFDQHELKARLRAGTRILDLQSELVLAKEALRDQATKDSLTGIWNRPTILEILERERARGQREQLPLGIVMMDLDLFKSVNDSYGHLAGDRVLECSTQRLRACIRPYDAIGRYGGEEFLIILPGCGEEAATGHAERMRQELEREPVRVDAHDIRVTASFGVTTSEPLSEIRPEDLIRAADDGLYAAKRSGRNRVCYLPATRAAACPDSSELAAATWK